MHMLLDSIAKIALSGAFLPSMIQKQQTNKQKPIDVSPRLDLLLSAAPLRVLSKEVAPAVEVCPVARSH
jgi:hypothetical protein